MSETPDSSTAPSPAVWSAHSAPDRPRGPRSTTLVLGLVLALCGGAATAVGLGVAVDLQLAVIVALVLAALLLLSVPLVQRRREPEERS